MLPLLVYRPNAMFSDGADHHAGWAGHHGQLARVDSHWLSQEHERVSNYLIAQFHTRGSADLLNDYAKLLPLFVFDGRRLPAEIGDRVLFGISGIFDGVNAEKANEVLGQAVGELVASSGPGPATTSPPG